LAKEVVAPTVYWICVLGNAIWSNNKLAQILDLIKIACVPSTTELIIAILAVVVLLIVAISEYKSEKRHVDILKDVYIPYTDGLLSFLYIECYYEWTYNVAIAGNTSISESQLDDLNELSNYLKTRVKHKEFDNLDRMYDSLANVVYDIYRLYNYYGDFSRKDEIVTIKRFYKLSPYNPNYDRDLKHYNDIVRLISDLILEQTRLCNLILKTIRKIHPDYQVMTGILHTDDIIDHGVYRIEDEESLEYRGLKEFMSARSSRNFYFGEGEIEVF